MTGKGELKKQIYDFIDRAPDKRIPFMKISEILDEAAKDAPKHYVYTDYTHDFGDPQSPDYVAPKTEDYPKYVHVPDDKEWLIWFKKYFGEAV